MEFVIINQFKLNEAVRYIDPLLLKIDGYFFMCKISIPFGLFPPYSMLSEGDMFSL